MDIAEKCGINVAITHIDRDSIPLTTGFLKELKESNPALNILAIILPEHFDYLGDELECLVDDFITIPIDLGELRIRLRKSLRHSQLVAIQPQPAAPFNHGETGLSSNELKALQLQHETPPLDYKVEIPENTVQGDVVFDNDIIHKKPSEYAAISSLEEEPLYSAVQRKTDIQHEGWLIPDAPFESRRQKVVDLPLVSPQEDPVQDDSTEIMEQEGNLIDGGLAEDMSALINTTRSRGGYKYFDPPKAEARRADKLSEPEPLPKEQHQPNPESSTANDSLENNKTQKGLLAKMLGAFSDQKSA